MAKNIKKTFQKTKFIIEHIDPLGQGVYKDGENIYFIPKTLPGETGVAKILKSKRNIHFCQLETLEHKSPERNAPACPHFDQCPGCHFLHTGYKSEIEFKSASFEHMLKPLGSPEFELIQAPERLGYRNRIQLHYSKRDRRLGFIQGKQNRILPVPGCKIFRPSLQDEFNKTYSEWNQGKIKQAKRPKGHVEIYQKEDGAIAKTWDKNYAEGGFTQVNKEMNEVLINTLRETLKPLLIESALDLFGGDGNLAQALSSKVKTLHIDIYPKGEKEGFYSHNLMDENSIDAFSSRVSQKQFDIFLVDPPRSGFKLINQWIERYSPKYIAYVSCHPQTMLRDIRSIERPYKLHQTKLLDLFPSTFHFEAMTLIELS